MMTRIQVLRSSDTVGHAIDFILEGSQTDFPVTDADGNILGMVLRNDLFSALRKHGEDASISYAISECALKLMASAALSDALQTLHTSQCNCLPVVEIEDGLLVGLLSLENIGEILMVKAAKAERSSDGFTGLSDKESSQAVPGQSF